MNVESGDDDDQIIINLVDGATTEINIDGGAPSASDSVTVTGTANDDIIAVDGLNLTFGGTLINLDVVENLTVEGGDGEDQISLTGTSVSGESESARSGRG